MKIHRKSMKKHENPEKIYEKARKSKENQLKNIKIQRKSLKKHENPKKIDEKSLKSKQNR